MGATRHQRRRLDKLLWPEIASRYLAGESTNALAGVLNVSESSIVHALKKSGVPRRQWRYKLKPYESEIIRRYLDGENMPGIAADMGVDASSIWNLLKRRNIRLRASSESNTEPSRRNWHPFRTITQESAYWAGFLTADGYLTKSGVTLNLAVIDAGHVEAFARLMRSTNRIHVVRWKKSGSEGRLFKIGSQSLAEDLRVLGVGPTKSNCLPALVLRTSRDFWRGVVDGDGCLMIRRRESGLLSPRLELCGHSTMIECFSSFARIVVPYWRGTPRRHSGQLFMVSFSGPAARNLIECLYKDASIALSRKHETARRILELATQSSSPDSSGGMIGVS